MEKKVMLIITESCNLECTYCYEHHKTKNNMSFDIAKNIVDKELKNTNNYKEITIEFIGGEAFLNFTLIKEIYEYIENNYSIEKILFFCTTNGTLIHGEIKNWLYKNRKNFFCSLSLDGTKEMHDINRPFKGNRKIGSFDKIDLNFFKRNWPNQTVKMTVSEATLSKFAEGVKYIENLGFNCMATFATGIKWVKDGNIEILVNQLSELVDYYILNPNQKLCKMLDIKLESIFVKINKNFRYCGAGTVLCAYDVKGDCYPCQGFAPITVGKLEAKKYLNSDFKNFCFSKDNQCIKCKFLRICPTCYASNKASTGNIEMQTPEMCLFNRLCALASSKIQYLRIMNKDKKKLTIKDQIILKAISIIQKDILKEEGKLQKYNSLSTLR